MVVIREIIAGGPADLNGKLKAGDRIVAVGQGKSGPMTDVIGWLIDDVVAQIRGKKMCIRDRAGADRHTGRMEYPGRTP